MPGGRGQFRFSTFELVALAASFLVTSVLVFLLGFYVGRDVASRHAAAGPEVARVPVADPVASHEESPAVARPIPQPPRPPVAKVAKRVARYTVQVQASRSRKEADDLASQLRKRGYDAFVTPDSDDNGRWYRVRVGHYESVVDARKTLEQCRTELGLEQAYVAVY